MEEREYLELREWTPLTDLWQHIPATLSKSLILTQEVHVTCLSAADEFIAIGSNCGLIFWYNRAKRTVVRLKCDSSSFLTCIHVVSSVEYLVAAGDKNGNVFIYQIPKEHPEDLLSSGVVAVKKATERYSVKDLHKVPVKCLEWSKNGMKLFSGDKSGVIVCTEIDYTKQESKSTVIFNEAYEIVQLRFQQQVGLLLISSIFRTVICERTTRTGQWKLQQVGKKDRKLLSICGGTFLNNDRQQPTIICSRPGGRFWVADVQGTVQKTLVFKDIFEARRPEVSLVNPSRKFMKITNEFQRVYPYLDDYCVTFNDDAVFVLNLTKNRVESTVKYLRGVHDVAVNNQEIFIVEGPRSIIRIAPCPDQFAEVRSTVFISSSLVTSASSGFGAESASYRENSWTEERDLIDAAECKELSPIEHLDIDKLLNDEWPSEGADQEDMNRSAVNVEEHRKKIEVFDQINNENYDENILYRSRRLKVVEATSPSEENKGIVEIAQLARADEDNEAQEQAEAGPGGPAETISNIQPEELNGQLDSEDVIDPGTRGTEPPPAEDEEEKEESVLSEILSYSSRFISDDNLQEMVNGMTSSWKGVSPQIILEEAELLHEIKDIPRDLPEVDQGYCDELEEEVDNESIPSEFETLLTNDWVVVTHQDCSASSEDFNLEPDDWDMVEENDFVDNL